MDIQVTVVVGTQQLENYRSRVSSFLKEVLTHVPPSNECRSESPELPDGTFFGGESGRPCSNFSAASVPGSRAIREGFQRSCGDIGEHGLHQILSGLSEAVFELARLRTEGKLESLVAGVEDKVLRTIEQSFEPGNARAVGTDLRNRLEGATIFVKLMVDTVLRVFDEHTGVGWQ